MDSGQLLGSEIHGFHSMQDLDMETIMEEAKTRWLRPNEIHAILYNNKRFSIHVKPVNSPKSGTVVLFDRKVLRNFRKDGHNWKKKKDGKTVKEAHEHLKVGNEERIHVYYAHGQDNPTFVRRCYWLLDKTLDHIVLVHYRETQELQSSPVTPVNSNSSSSATNQPTPLALPEEFDSVTGHGYYAGEQEFLGPGESLTLKNHQMRLNELNTLEWDELVANVPDNSTTQKGDKALGMDEQNQIAANYAAVHSAYNSPVEASNLGSSAESVTNTRESQYARFAPNGVCRQTAQVHVNANGQRKDPSVLRTGQSLDILVNDGLQSQDSFGRWVNYIIADSPVSGDDAVHASSKSSGWNSCMSSVADHHQLFIPEQKFFITDVSPPWAFSNEITKVLVIGNFQEQYLHLAKSNLLCVCGDACFPLELVQAGVYRCLIRARSQGIVNFYLSLDGHQPISQVMNFEHRNPPIPSPVVSSEDRSNWEELQLQMRLSHLLFSTMKNLNILNTKVAPAAMKGAKKFAHRSSIICDSWTYLIKSIESNKISYDQAKDGLLELTLKNLLKEWLSERVVEGCKETDYDAQGLGVIHLCAILGYIWAVHLYSWSGLSINFRDKHGWSALHWAAYYGREKMVAVLLSAGANPNWVTDPTSKNPAGCTAADLASANGYEGLAAYLSEKALVAHFEAMSVAGNVSGSLQSNNPVQTMNSENLSEEEINLKESLAAYRTAADAAARIQTAFREHSLKVRTKAVQLDNLEIEARNIVAAMKIQHAFRNYESRKQMAAAARIQYRFRTWKVRKEFLSMRRQAIKIQAAFRGFQARKQYRKIVWSVGVLEKAILRWRLKRKGFRGLHVDPAEEFESNNSEDAEEDFYRTSQKQAEERVERAVIRVQAMFRSKKAQTEYRRMKLAHNVAALEYKLLLSDNEMDG